MIAAAPSKRGIGRRRGLPLLLAGLGLFAYLGLTPHVPHERRVSYRFPAPQQADELEIRWTEPASGETIRAARFAVAAQQQQSSHTLLLADGDYVVEADLPGRSGRSLATRRVRVDSASFAVVFE